MLAEVAHAVVEVVLQAILEFVFYWFGRIIVAVFTLGRVQCDLYDRKSTWSGCWRVFGKDSDGAYLGAEATSCVGLLSIIALMVLLL
jgi:hypothetical protein